ncbi:MAG: nicotinate-nucleotide--dimethylbenzimidazole phosphoribosyltransferase [Butyrivibrio sp.]|nr:nicotinate-nucleotide--dimethylbenzimidazole phosphoribosyltransferase [Butyrivibrio sp.]
MTKVELFDIQIQNPNRTVFDASKEKWDSISKPIDGLGDFETLICKIAAMRGEVCPDISKRALVVMCADNGIVEEGISQSDKSITKAVAEALGKGISSACTLAKNTKVDVVPVDIGIDTDEKIDGVRDLKVRKGTRNFLMEPAMSETETVEAISTGISLATELSEEGYSLIATGEMGIGNTTTSTAVLSALLSINSDEITGRGAGLSDSGLNRKREVIKAGLLKYDFNIEDEKERAFEILRTLGGLDIAGLVGVFIGGALCRVPTVIDGVISATAAIIADMIVPGARLYMLPSHNGREKGCSMALSYLGLSSYINGNMALGEGTGALMLFPILDMVMDFYKSGALFEDYEIDKYTRLS